MDNGIPHSLSPAGLLPAGEFVEDSSKSLGVMSSISPEEDNINHRRKTALARPRAETEGFRLAHLRRLGEQHRLLPAGLCSARSPPRLALRSLLIKPFKGGMKSCMDTIHYLLFTLPVSPNLKPDRRASEAKRLHTGLLAQESIGVNAENLAVWQEPAPETDAGQGYHYFSYIANSPNFISAFLFF